jgi:hypothetical protein
MEIIGFHFSYGYVLGTEMQAGVSEIISKRKLLCVFKNKFFSVKYFCSKYAELVSCHCIKVELG